MQKERKVLQTNEIALLRYDMALLLSGSKTNALQPTKKAGLVNDR
jgi:hypothetical protein